MKPPVYIDPYRQLKEDIADVVNDTIPSPRIFKMIMGISAEDLAESIAKISKRYLDKRLKIIEHRLSELEKRK